jgi:hypothetical protein
MYDRLINIHDLFNCQCSNLHTTRSTSPRKTTIHVYPLPSNSPAADARKSGRYQGRLYNICYYIRNWYVWSVVKTTAWWHCLKFVRTKWRPFYKMAAIHVLKCYIFIHIVHRRVILVSNSTVWGVTKFNAIISKMVRRWITKNSKWPIKMAVFIELKCIKICILY